MSTKLFESKKNSQPMGCREGLKVLLFTTDLEFEWFRYEKRTNTSTL